MEGTAGRPRRRAVSPVFPGVVAALTLLTFRSVSFAPIPGLDPSWHAALHMAARHRMPFGDRLVFSFGPLGFLAQPVAYYTSTGFLSGLYVLGLEAALCASLLAVLHRSVGLAGAAVVTFVAAGAAALELKAAELVVVVVVVGAFGLLRGDHAPRTERLLVLAGGVAAGSQLLVKFNTGATVAAVATVTAWFVGRRAWRSEAELVGAAVAALAAGWVATGNRVGDLVPYLRHSVDVASGYSEAMGIEARDRAVEYPVAAVVVAVLLALAWAASRGWPRGRRVGLGLVGAVWLYAALKHGFVRHDPHDIVFFGEALVVGVAVAGAVAAAAGPRGRWLPAAAGLVLLGAFLHASGSSVVDVVDVLPALRGAGREALYAVSGGRRSAAVDRARARLRAAYGLDPDTLAALAGHTVHVHPWEAQVAWAYPEIRWLPVPVFQEYSAYTPALDRLDADFLAGPDAPERILTEDTTIDFRNPDWESPAGVVAMACHYRELVAQARWQVLGRVPDRCGAEQLLATVTARVGDTMTVPQADDPDTLVVARIRGLDSSPLYGLRSALLRVPEVHVSLDGGRRYRLVPGTAVDGVLVGAPADPAVLGFSEAFAPGSARTLRVETGGGWGLGTTLHVDFVAIPLHSGA